MDALDTWLQESNLDVINIAEISKQAGVTRSAFYFYFENKGAAVAALMERMIDETIVVNEHFTAAEDAPRRRIYAMLDGLFEMRARHHHLFKAMLEVRGSSSSVRDIWDGARASFTDSIAEMIRRDRAAGRAPDGLDPDVLAAVLLEVNDRLLERLTLGGTLTSAQLKDGVAAIWLSSVYGITGLAEHSQETA
ncbi:MAG: TetR/AcrR family transcriptional regulator, ethionamide resistance regulator [Mycobacterium sp.]|nr:TetR/AcrR family transcriptional regulator, ethionamide resistance regulator [Mycobacterium sp.]